MKSSKLLLYVVVALMVASCSKQPEYDGSDDIFDPDSVQVFFLEDVLGQNHMYSTAMAVSDDGSSIVGTAEVNSNPGPEGFIWENNNISFIGRLPGLGFGSSAIGVSSTGAYIAGYGFETFGGQNEESAALWEGDELKTVLDGYLSKAKDVSSDGTKVVGVSSYYAVCWSDSTMTRLSSKRGSTANAVSNDGQKIVGRDSTTDGYEAVYWENDVPHYLGDLPGGEDRSEAFAIGNDKNIIVGYGTSEKGQEACLWKDDEIISLGVLDPSPGIYNSVALDISADGNVVVGSSNISDSEAPDGMTTVAFIWIEGRGMIDLTKFLEEELNTDLDGGVLTQATGVSADGSVVVGNVRNDDGLASGFKVVFH